VFTFIAGLKSDRLQAAAQHYTLLLRPDEVSLSKQLFTIEIRAELKKAYFPIHIYSYRSATTLLFLLFHFCEEPIT
jgi:hypothetical protein